MFGYTYSSANVLMITCPVSVRGRSVYKRWTIGRGSHRDNLLDVIRRSPALNLNLTIQAALPRIIKAFVWYTPFDKFIDKVPTLNCLVRFVIYDAFFVAGNFCMFLYTSCRSFGFRICGIVSNTTWKWDDFDVAAIVWDYLSYCHFPIIVRLPL